MVIENTKNTDPTLNVREMINEAIGRLDDLRKAEIRRLDDLSESQTKQMEDKIRDKDNQYQLQFASAKEAVGIALIAQEKQVAAALEGTKEAINKADINTDKRFSLLSEKIDGITTTMNKSTGEKGVYVTHSDLSSELEKLRLSFEGMLRPVINFMNSATGQDKGQHQMWGYVVGGAGVLIAIFAYLSAHPVIVQAVK